MTGYFVVSTDPMSADHEKMFGEFIKQQSAWWHWLPNFWLVVDRGDTLRASHIRDRIYQISKNYRCVVLKVDPVTWATLGRKDSLGRDFDDWIKKNWKA